VRARRSSLELTARGGAGSGFFVGDDLTIADLKALPLMEWLTCGVLDYIPTDLLKDAPNLLRNVKATNKAYTSSTR